MIVLFFVCFKVEIQWRVTRPCTTLALFTVPMLYSTLPPSFLPFYLSVFFLIHPMSGDGNKAMHVFFLLLQLKALALFSFTLCFGTMIDPLRPSSISGDCEF